MNTITELREKRGVLETELLNLEAKVTSKTMTAADETRFTALIETEIPAIEVQIGAEERKVNAIENAKKRSQSVNFGIGIKKTDNEDQVKANFSYRGFILEAAEGQLTGFNKEIHQEGVNEMRQSNVVPKGHVIPAFILKGEERALTTGTGDTAKAGYLIQTDVMGEQYIDVLRNSSVAVQAGARFMGGLVGNVAIPKLTTSAGGAWLSENGAITAADNVHGQLSGTPKRYGNATVISKTLLRQSSLDAEMIVRNDLSRTHAIAVDTAAFVGTGSSNQPTGITATAGIGSVALGANGTAPTWAMFVGLESEVANDNAAFGKLHYVTNSKVRGKSKTVVRDAGSGLFLYDSGDMINGYKCFISNSIPSNLTKGSSSGICSAAIFGNFDDLMILQWGGVDLVIDGVTLALNNQIQVVANGYYDILVRRAESFAACLDILTT